MDSIHHEGKEHMAGDSVKSKPVCYIFGAGQPPACPPETGAGDLVVAADGGYAWTQAAGIRTDVVIGDFDSLGHVPELSGDGPVVVSLPAEKDETDTLAALRYGLERGFRCFHIYGGTGGRLDHTVANIQCLVYLAVRGARGYLHDRDTVLTAFGGEILLAARLHGTISVFALGGPAEGVWLRGLKYELENAVLTPDFPLGGSNAFTGQPASIKSERGVLLVVYPAGTQEL